MRLYNKNTTPGALAAYNGFILAVVTATGCLLATADWPLTIGTFVVVFLVSFGLFQYSLQKFVYRKIKLIYKIIYRTKATQREDFFNKQVLPQKTMDEVRQDVERWAEQKSDEIADLRLNEKYRKEFLYNLSHELKTPVFAIQGYVHTLLDGADKDPAVSRQFLERATKNVDRLCALIDDLDEITEIESGQIRLNQSTFTIQEEIRDVFHTLEQKAREKNIAFSIKKGCEAPLKVWADRDKIHRVLINLIDNAVKYGRNEGQIVASFYDLDGKQVLVEISDNGIGINEDHLGRVFERFYRTDKGRDRNIGGSGLGLAIVKHLVEAHGQSIHVRSKPKIGSTFGFTLQMGKE